MTPRRFPAHTIVLMICALAAFAWFFWMTVVRPQRRVPGRADAGGATVRIVPPGSAREMPVDKTPRSR